VLNQIGAAIEREGITQQQTIGKTVRVLVEQRVCNICRQGLPGTDVPAGVLKQFSDRFPRLTIEIAAEGTEELLRIRGGRYIGFAP